MYRPVSQHSLPPSMPASTICSRPLSSLSLKSTRIRIKPLFRVIDRLCFTLSRKCLSSGPDLVCLSERPLWHDGFARIVEGRNGRDNGYRFTAINVPSIFPVSNLSSIVLRRSFALTRPLSKLRWPASIRRHRSPRRWSSCSDRPCQPVRQYRLQRQGSDCAGWTRYRCGYSERERHETRCVVRP
jgi:hypothetical protein